MKSFRLGTLRPDGTVEPASMLAAEILAAMAAGDDSRQRALLVLAASLDRGTITGDRVGRYGHNTGQSNDDG